MNMKKKHIIALIIVSVSYLIIVLTIKYRYEYKKEHEICKGFNSASNRTRIKLAIQSEIDVFNVDDVSFDIYYGIYEEGDDNPQGGYKFDDESVVFAMYMGENDYDDEENRIINGTVYSNYKNIGRNILIKEILEEEAFSGKYTYTTNQKKKITYKHSEKVTVLKELFNKQEGLIAIKISAFVPKKEGYECSEMEKCIILKYKYLDEDTVRIKCDRIK